MEVELDVGMAPSQHEPQPEAATLQCAQCSSSFADPVELEQHVVQEHAPQPHTMALHMQQHHQQQAQNQQLLQFLPAEQSQMQGPVAAHSAALAAQHFMQPALLSSPQTQLFHNEADHPRFACTQCSKRFYQASDLHEHVSTHQTISKACGTLNALNGFDFDLLSSFSSASLSFPPSSAALPSAATLSAAAATEQALSCAECHKTFSTAFALEQHRFVHRVQHHREGDSISVNAVSGGYLAAPDPPSRPSRHSKASSTAAKAPPRLDRITLLFQEYERRFDVLTGQEAKAGAGSEATYRHDDAALAAFLCEHAKSEASEARRWASPFPAGVLYSASVRPITWIFPSD